MAVRQTPDGRWYSAYKKGRNPARPDSTRQYFGRGEEGRLAAEKFDRDLPDRRKPVKDGQLSFSQLANEYLTAALGQISESDMDNTIRKLQSIISPRIGHLPASRITPAELDRFVQGRLADKVRVHIGSGRFKETDRHVKKTTVHRELSIVRAILNWGVERKRITSSPMVGYKMPRRDDMIVLPPTEEEFDKLLANAAPHCRRMILLSYYTGLRPGRQEAYSLTWDNVDLHGDTITIISAEKGGLPVREVPLHPELKRYLLKWKKVDDEKKIRYIIHWHGRQIATSMKTAWNAAKKRAGITKRIRPYSLRHKSITDMLEAGGDLGSVAKIVGHADPETTMKVYQRVNSEMKRKAVNLLPGTTLKVVPEE